MVLVIKFHEANKRHLHNRFNVILNDFDCSKILRTVINIAEAELKKNQFASFAFVGVPKEGKETRNTANSQRHRIYRKLAEYFLGPQTFLHSYEQRSNCYLLVNKRNVNPAALQTAIVDMFAEHFHELSHL